MKQIPFYAVYRCHLTNNFPIVATVENPVAEDFVKNLIEIQSTIIESVIAAAAGEH